VTGFGSVSQLIRRSSVERPLMFEVADYRPTDVPMPVVPPATRPSHGPMLTGPILFHCYSPAGQPLVCFVLRRMSGGRRITRM
jgi:hypothetical protein